MGSTLRWLFFAALAIILGMLTSHTQDIHNITASNYYTLFVYTLLSIGLYGSVYNINIAELKLNRAIVLQAVTGGVLLKIILISSIFYVITKNPVAALLSVTVAQIDPLSVARLLSVGRSRLSTTAKTILGAWSSFDDPITVLVSVYVASIITPQTIGDPTMYLTESLIGYASTFMANVLLVIAIYVLYRSTITLKKVQYILLIIAFVIAIIFHLALAIALIGLFLRPKLDRVLPALVNGALYAALFTLGLITVEGIDLWQGLILAIAAILAQMGAVLVFTRSLTTRDRVHLALSQQNGITAIILALLFEQTHGNIVAIVAPAIVIINIGHMLLNALADQQLEGRSYPTPS